MICLGSFLTNKGRFSPSFEHKGSLNNCLLPFTLYTELSKESLSIFKVIQSEPWTKFSITSQNDCILPNEYINTTNESISRELVRDPTHAYANQ